MMDQQRTWWKEAVVYQVYPRSFRDSNGDGIGDLRGIISKLDYIQSLGVDAIWLNPIYKSPNDDGGYDISDYYQIQPEFGTMADFDELLHGMHRRGLKLIMDLVLNHSSDEHPWFEASAQNKDNPYRDYYFWRPGRNGGPPNNWPSFFGGSAWQYDERTGEYYLHLFSRKQPDLNWENPRLRDELARIMEFWVRKGVDGLRLDVISAISKTPGLPDTDTDDFNETIRRRYANGPRLKEFLAEMNNRVWRPHQVFTVGEGPGITPANASDYLNDLNMIFHFGHMFIDQGPGGRFDPVPWSMKEFKEVFQRWDTALARTGWGSIFLGNHDFPRMVSRWGNDATYHAESAKLLITLLLSMRGTPFIFMGDEFGTKNIHLNSLNESQDIETLNGWREAKAKGMPEQEFLRRANYAGRDNARSPLAWDGSETGDFTTGQPWMSLNPSRKEINVAVQEKTPDSIIAYFREMVRLRKQNPALMYGEYQPLESGNDQVFVYHRTMDKEKWTVTLNFSSSPAKLPSTWTEWGRLVKANYKEPEDETLGPWEARIYHVE